MIKKSIVGLIIIITTCLAQGLKIVHMEGTYDLDGDGLKEFATIESGSVGGKQLSVAVSYTHLTLPTICSV